MLKNLFEDIVSLMHQSLWERVMHKDERYPHDEKENLELHRRILEAIKNHDPLTAVRALEYSYRAIKKYLYGEAL